MRPEDAPFPLPRMTDALDVTHGGTSLRSPEIAQVVGTGTVIDTAPKRVINIPEDVSILAHVTPWIIGLTQRRLPTRSSYLDPCA
jgi:hypothetical protein